MNLEAMKAEAARAAAGEIRSGMALGLGTGSTVAHLLPLLKEGLSAGRWQDLRCVATSERTATAAAALGLRLFPLEELKTLDLCIDGADEVAPNLDCTKGLGAALLREKIVALAARRFVVIADESKRVAHLLERAPLPIEVVPFAHPLHLSWLEEQGLRPELRRKADGEPALTDNGNLLIDAYAGTTTLSPRELAQALDQRSGIVDHGLFLGLCQRAYLATSEGVVILDA